MSLSAPESRCIPHGMVQCPVCDSPKVEPANCRFCNDEGCDQCKPILIDSSENIESNTETRLVEIPSKRFSVTLQHTIIVYDDTAAGATARAPLMYQSLFKQPAARPLEVVSCVELGTIDSEPQTAIIDVSPVLQRT
jgi:hypothetical protein